MAAARPETPAFLICFAVKEEAGPFVRGAGSRSNVRTLVTGMGTANARNAVSQSLAHAPSTAVLTCGFAGGLNPSLEVGDVVFEADSDFPMDFAHTGAKPGSFACVERVLITAREKAALWKSSGCDAVEMESQAIRELCRARGIPSATLRVISDSSQEELPLDFNSLMTAEMKIDFGKLGWEIVKRPTLISKLLKFHRQTSRAAERLAVVLNQVIAAWPPSRV